MEALIVKIDKKEDMTFLRKLLRKLNFVYEVKASKSLSDKDTVKTKALASSIQWAKSTSTPSIQDFAGIWKDRKITQEQLRGSARKKC